MRNRKDRGVAVDAAVLKPNPSLLQAVEAVLHKEEGRTDRVGLSSQDMNRFINATKQLLNSVENFKAQQEDLAHAQHERQTLKQTLATLREEVSSIKEQLGKLRQQYEQLRSSYEELQSSSNQTQQQHQITIKQLQEQLNKMTIERSQLIRVASDRHQQVQIMSERLQLMEESVPQKKQRESIQWASANILGKIVVYLWPKQICQLSRVNHQFRKSIIGSENSSKSIFFSITRLLNKKIRRIKGHIDFFEERFNEIPEEAIQTSYFQHHIAKQPIGPDLTSVINASAPLFDGKIDLQPVLVPQAEPLSNQQISDGFLLQVDHQIVAEYQREKKEQDDRMGKMAEVMEQKISSSVQLYRADPQSIRPFTQNILRMFARLFVTSKMTLSQAQSLHKLNCFLLKQISQRDQDRVDINAQLQDLKARLEAQVKMRLFFTDKSIKSEQKALFEEHLRLKHELSQQQLNDSLTTSINEKNALQEEHTALVETNRLVDAERIHSQRQFQILREKYRQLTQQLAVLRQTVLKMSIL